MDWHNKYEVMEGKVKFDKEFASALCDLMAKAGVEQYDKEVFDDIRNYATLFTS